MKNGGIKELTGLSAGIVSAYVARNTVPASELPALLERVHEALAEAEGPGGAPEPVPAVPVKDAVKPRAVVCLECGREFKALKRHLSSEHDLDPDGYRQKWSLSEDFPLVAPEYSRRRSDMARRLGLGRKPAAKVGQRGT